MERYTILRRKQGDRGWQLCSTEDQPVTRTNREKSPQRICLAGKCWLDVIWSSELLSHWIGGSLILSIVFVYWTIMNWFILLHGVYPTSRTSLCMVEVA